MLHLQAVERKYNQQLSRGQPSARATFDYAHHLVRSSKQQEIRIGQRLFERELFCMQIVVNARMSSCRTVPPR